MARRRKPKTLFYRKRGKVFPIRAHPAYDPVKAGEVPKHLRPAFRRFLASVRASRRRRRRR